MSVQDRPARPGDVQERHSAVKKRFDGNFVRGI
jgi:hypothetical protein